MTGRTSFNNIIKFAAFSGTNDEHMYSLDVDDEGKVVIGGCGRSHDLIEYDFSANTDAYFAFMILFGNDFESLIWSKYYVRHRNSSAKNNVMRETIFGEDD